MLNYLLDKCRHLLHEQLDDFLQEFQCTFEHNWHKFVKITFQKINKQPAKLTEIAQNIKVELQIMLEIIIRMPIRKEIKNEISYLQSKVKAFAQKYELLIV